MLNQKIICDNCIADLTYTENSIAYRIVCKGERIPCFPNSPVTDMMIYPPFPFDLHFCGTDCLKQWINKNI